MTSWRDRPVLAGAAAVAAVVLVSGGVALLARQAAPAVPPSLAPGPGVAGQAGGDGPVLEPSAPSTGRRDLLEACDATPSTKAAAGPAPAQVYLCDHDAVPVPGDGVWTERVVRPATGDVGPLLASLRAHDDPAENLACPAIAYRRYVVLLVTADGDVRVGVPFLGTACGGDGTPAVTAAGFTGEVARARLERAQTEAEAREARRQAAADASAQKVGCAGSWKDMASVEVADARPPGRALIAADLWSDDATVRICLFEVSAPLSAPDLPVGVFATGRRLTAEQSAQVRTALLSPAPAATDTSCAGQADRFVVLSPDPGSFVVAHLDGCRLVDVDGHGVRVPDQGLTSLLERLATSP